MTEAPLERELRSGLVLLGAGLLLLPWVPDVGRGPYGAVNPQVIARVALAVLGISVGGHLAERMLGARYGLLVSGFVAGFVSSSATIAAMGLRAKADPRGRNRAVAGGLASSIATVVFFAALVGSVDPRLLVPLSLPLGLAAGAAVGGTLLFARADAAVASDARASEPAPRSPTPIWVPALLIGGASTLLSVIGAALGAGLGSESVVVVSAVAGLVDAHATSASVAGLHRAEQLGRDAALLSVVVALSSNTVTKVVMASLSRDLAYTLRLSAGVVAIALAAWLGLLIQAL